MTSVVPTRYKLFKAGELTIDDLDDEELAACGFRGSDGRIVKPRKIPRDIALQFIRGIHDRANKELRKQVINAAKQLADLMMDPKVDAALRLKAAESILDRNLGKAPQIVALTQKTPFEETFESILGGSRDESRQRRAIESGSTVQQHDSAETNEKRNIIDTDADESFAGFTEVESSQRYSSFTERNTGSPRPNGRNKAVLTQELKLHEFKYDIPLRRLYVHCRDGKTRIRHVA